MVEGVPVTSYHAPVERINVPPPYTPKQKVSEMVLNGVDWGANDFNDPGLPLHEGLGRIQARLNSAFENSVSVREEPVKEALLALMERSAQYLRSLGMAITISVGGKSTQTEIPNTLYEKLTMLRVWLEEDSSGEDPALLRGALLDVAARARERARLVRKPEVKPTLVVAPKKHTPKKTTQVFDNEVDYIVHVIGKDTLKRLAP
jgi:hypothetical protein